METLIQILGENGTLAAGVLVIGIAFGFLAQRSRFCMRSAVIEFSRNHTGGKLTVWLFALGAAVAVVVREAARACDGRAGRHRQVRVHVVHHGGLAAAVGAGYGHELRAVGVTFEVQRQGIEPQAGADAAEALESEQERLHGMPLETSAIASQRARLRPFAGATPQAFDKDLTVADAP